MICQIVKLPFVDDMSLEVFDDCCSQRIENELGWRLSNWEAILQIMQIMGNFETIDFTEQNL